MKMENSTKIKPRQQKGMVMENNVKKNIFKVIKKRKVVAITKIHKSQTVDKNIMKSLSK